MRAELEKIAELVCDEVHTLPESFDKGKELGMGADGTPTSNIDKVAEDVIIRYVNEEDLPMNVLSEECGWIDRHQESTLVIDPIDGTHNSSLGVPLYSVSLALGKGSLCGVEECVVRNVVNDDVFYAKKGEGSYLNGRKLKVRSYNKDVPALLVYMGRYASPRTIDVIKRSGRIRALGCASLEMCLVAQGKFDAYYFNSEVYQKSIRVIDIAASALILREAGGDIVDLSGKKLDMPFDLASRSNFLAYGDIAAKEAML